MSDERDSDDGPDSGRGPLEVEPVSRRGFLLRFGIGLNVIAASFIAIPVIGYVISAVVRPKAETGKTPGEAERWIAPRRKNSRGNAHEPSEWSK